MDTARHSLNAALISLESTAATARSGFACMFSSSDEYEHALISQRRAQGRYQKPASPLPMLMCICCVAAIVAVALWLE